MKFVTLIALALLPIVLGTPVPDDTTDTDDPSISKWRVKQNTYCYYEPYENGGHKKEYYKGNTVYVKCRTTGGTDHGDWWWSHTTDDCYVPEYYLGYESGSTTPCIIP